MSELKWLKLDSWPNQTSVEQVPLQGEWTRESHTNMPHCTIPKWLAEIAYTRYIEHGGHGQTLERLCERGGFGRSEFLAFLYEALKIEAETRPTPERSETE